MLFDFYGSVTESIYECDGDNPAIAPTRMRGVYTSNVSVPIEKETRIDNVYDEILKQESSGKIIIRRYNQLSSDEKNKIFKQIVRAIHNLLNASDESAGQSVTHFHIHIIPRKYGDKINAWPEFKGAKQDVQTVFNKIKLQ